MMDEREVIKRTIILVHKIEYILNKLWIMTIYHIISILVAIILLIMGQFVISATIISVLFIPVVITYSMVHELTNMLYNYVDEGVKHED